MPLTPNIDNAFKNLTLSESVDSQPIEIEHNANFSIPSGPIHSRTPSSALAGMHVAPDVHQSFLTEIESFDRKNLRYTLQESLPKLIKSISSEGSAGRIIHNSLDRYALAHNVELTMLDGSTLCALDNTNKHSKPGFNTNCYGFALTSGQYWVTQRQLLNWLENQTLYTLRDSSSGKQGDLVLWRSEEIGIEHIAVLATPGQVRMASGIHLYNGMQTTTVDIDQGWAGRNCTMQYWGLSDTYYSLVKGGETPSEQLPAAPPILGGRQMRGDPPGDAPEAHDTRITRPPQRRLDP